MARSAHDESKHGQEAALFRHLRESDLLFCSAEIIKRSSAGREAVKLDWNWHETSLTT